ncbi:MAG: DUF368 domain-containing protein [Chitinophagaceae bacterium]|nr:DUF368 domain-containing protein [Chitinophagaceae bacterium]
MILKNILQTNKLYFVLYLKGIAVGIATIIPGISGGTLAFITGVYEDMLYCIRSFDLQTIKLFTSFQIKKGWERINGTFLLLFLSGLLTSVIALADVAVFILTTYPIYTMSFFLGVVGLSSIIVFIDIHKWGVEIVLYFIVGIILAYITTILSPIQAPNDAWIVFIAGFLGIIAMMLPGISGGFVLVILNQYQYILQALSEWNFFILIVFVLGIISGLFLSSRLITWVLDKFHNKALSFLSGFTLGSLNEIWPWKVFHYGINDIGEKIIIAEDHIMPWHYMEETRKASQFLEASLFFVLGMGVVIILGKIVKQMKK